ncbi:MAG: hypothetical protein PVI54_17180, partial [Desulfobacteraceae bacterium]
AGCGQKDTLISQQHPGQAGDVFIRGNNTQIHGIAIILHRIRHIFAEQLLVQINAGVHLAPFIKECVEPIFIVIDQSVQKFAKGSFLPLYNQLVIERKTNLPWIKWLIRITLTDARLVTNDFNAVSTNLHTSSIFLEGRWRFLPISIRNTMNPGILQISALKMKSTARSVHQLFKIWLR